MSMDEPSSHQPHDFIIAYLSFAATLLFPPDNYVRDPSNTGEDIAPRHFQETNLEPSFARILENPIDLEA